MEIDGSSNGREDTFGCEKINTAVDQVRDVRFWLLNIMKNSAGVRIGNDATKIAGSIFTDTGTKNDSFSISVFE